MELFENLLMTVEGGRLTHDLEPGDDVLGRVGGGLAEIVTLVN